MTLSNDRKIVEAATQGEWLYSKCYGVATIESVDGTDIAHAVDYLTPDNATFISTFNPVKVQKMLDVIEAAKDVQEWAEDDAVREALEALEK